MKSYKPLVEELQLDPLLGTAEMAALLGFSENHIRRLARQGKIATPVKLGGRKLGWRVSTAKKLLAQQDDADQRTARDAEGQS